MKTTRFLFMVIAVVALLSSCKKYDMATPNIPRNPGNGGGDNNYSYVWTGCKPSPVQEIGKTPVGTSVNGIAIFDYQFRMSLDGSQIDPNPLRLERFEIPHVGPGGVTIYENVANDATYTITKISDGYIYYTIRSEIGHTLKYNISVLNGSQRIWFLCYGLANDDNVNNIITFVSH